MGSKLHIPSIVFFFLWLVVSTCMAGPGGKGAGGKGTTGGKEAGGKGTFNIGKYGAKGDGKSDDSKALLAAWKEACKAPGGSRILIPKGTFMMNSVTLEGPCSGSMNLIVRGNVKAPANPAAMTGDSLLTVNRIDKFTLNGGGSLDGQGEQAWKQNNCHKTLKCKQTSMNLRLNFVNNSVIEKLTSLNSKNFHVNIISCRNLTIKSFKIKAPAESLNTDGIHLGRSNSVHIIDTQIGTGDDCISVGDGTENLYITAVTCGPGHGISVGSLGGSPNEAPVNGIFLKNCTLTGTDNGIRIKTWPNRESGTATNMHFEDVIMNNVTNPILIDQGYCPHNLCSKDSPSKVKISNVSYKNIRGTSSTKLAVSLICSSRHPCKDVKLSNIDLKLIGGGSADSQAINVKPQVSGKLNPSFTKS